jgi:L-threonylcarbamoyladenylate synthase
MQTIIGNDISFAASLLRRGEVVAIPTETVYGLAGNALNEEAVIRIYEAKQRPRFNPLILHVDSFQRFSEYAHSIPDACMKLAEYFTPGPLTFLLPKKDNVPAIVTAGSERVALRVPAHPVARALLQQLDFPLAAPSANPSGYVSPVTAGHVYDGLQGLIPYILDGGPCQVGLESTIIGFEENGIVIYRHGALAAEELQAVSGLPVRVHTGTGSVETPGSLKSHYAPTLPLWIGDVNQLLREHAGKKAAVISFRQAYTDPRSDCSYVLSPGGDLHEAARNLFRVLREIDRSDAEIILAEKFPSEGIGYAINDRLERAQFEFR